MKYTKQITTGVVAMLLAVGCQNGDWSFPDYGTTTVSFPFQTPVRTLIQGEANGYDVTLDHKNQFQISISMGGVYENKTRRVVKYELASDLVGDIQEKDSAEIIEVLPSNYYTLSDNGQFVIPSGRTDGRITVQLLDPFFDDPNAYKTHYVIPMRLTEAIGIDSIHAGAYTSQTAPGDIRFEDGWTSVPKNYTLFGIKFQNKYHGKYLLRGVTEIRDIDNDTLVGRVVYHDEFIEYNEQVMFNTNGRSSFFINGYSLRAPSNAANNPHLYPNAANTKAGITVRVNDETGAATISGDYSVDGTGKWLSKENSEETWGGKKRSAFYMHYTAKNPNSYLKYEAYDTLVYMSNMVAFETFTLEKINP